jgi:hypothetical protein
MRDMRDDGHPKREGPGYGPEQPRQSLESAESDVPTGIRSGDSSDSLRLGYWNQEVRTRALWVVVVVACEVYFFVSGGGGGGGSGCGSDGGGGGGSGV